jgi:hypothetical protein
MSCLILTKEKTLFIDEKNIAIKNPPGYVILSKFHVDTET